MTESTRLEHKPKRINSTIAVRSKEYLPYTGGSHSAQTKKFKTLVEVQTYVKDRWQGVEYIDSSAGFHTDYCSFELIGCTLKDLGKRGTPGTDSFWDWEWIDLTTVTTAGGPEISQ